MSTLRSTGAMLLVICSPAHSQSTSPLAYCEPVLRNINEQTSTFTSGFVENSLAKAACDENFADYQGFSGWAGSAGVTAPIVEAIFDFSAEASSSSQTFKREYESSCSTFAASGASASLNALNRKTIETKAFDVWSKCITDIANGRADTYGLFLAVEQEIEGIYTVNVTQRNSAGRDIQFKSISPSIVTCTYRGTNVIGQDFQALEFPIECSKTVDKLVRATFETTEATAKNVVFPDREKDPSLREWLVDNTVPAGAVLAFDLPQCPQGWAEYRAAAGKAVVGINGGESPSLDRYVLGETVGEKEVTLTVENLPPHAHSGTTADPSRNGVFQSIGAGGGYHAWALGHPSYLRGSNITNQELPFPPHTHSFTTDGGQGKSASFKIVPPSIALRYCQKFSSNTDAPLANLISR